MVELLIKQIFPEIMRLSVGGQHFKTSLLTLCKDPNSMLAARFSGLNTPKKMRMVAT